MGWKRLTTDEDDPDFIARRDQLKIEQEKRDAEDLAERQEALRLKHEQEDAEAAEELKERQAAMARGQAMVDEANKGRWRR